MPWCSRSPLEACVRAKRAFSRSAETALGRPLAGAISIDPGVSVIALGQYLSLGAIAFVSAAVAVDRQRAGWILFALTAAGVAIALILLAHDLVFPGIGFPPFERAQATDCTAISAIAAGAACVRVVECREAPNSNVQRSVLIFSLPFAAGAAALVICAGTLIAGAAHSEIFATGCGVAALAGVMIIRGFGLGRLGVVIVAAPAVGVAVILAASNPPERGKSAPLAFAAVPSASPYRHRSRNIRRDRADVSRGGRPAAGLARSNRGGELRDRTGPAHALADRDGDGRVL